MISFEWYMDESDDELVEINDEPINVALVRRTIRDGSNPLKLPNTKFLSYFRLSKDAFCFVLAELQKHMIPTVRSSSILPIIKLAAALRFFAEGGYQKGVGNDFSLGLGQSTVCLVLKEVLNILETHVCHSWITFQRTAEEKERTKLAIYNKTGFPGVIGCVDGTQINIIRPNKDIQHLYFNRKGTHSINAMIVCDHEMKILSIVANNAGSMHDSAVWHTSSVRCSLLEDLENGERNAWLLGDSGYPLEPFLITPFRETDEHSPERAFNDFHSSSRNIVERTIGVLKNRFRCLLSARELHYVPEKVTQIINVCVCLHNICLFYKVGDNYADLNIGDNTTPVINVEIDEENEDEPHSTIASRIRNEIVNMLT